MSTIMPGMVALSIQDFLLGPFMCVGLGMLILLIYVLDRNHGDIAREFRRDIYERSKLSIAGETFNFFMNFVAALKINKSFTFLILTVNLYV